MTPLECYELMLARLSTHIAYYRQLSPRPDAAIKARISHLETRRRTIANNADKLRYALGNQSYYYEQVMVHNRQQYGIWLKRANADVEHYSSLAPTQTELMSEEV